MTITTREITAYETLALTLIRDNKVDYFDSGYEEGTSYGFALTDALCDNSDLNEQGAGGVLSSLIQKGLILASEYEGETSIMVSRAGVEIIKGLVA